MIPTFQYVSGGHLFDVALCGGTQARAMWDALEVFHVAAGAALKSDDDENVLKSPPTFDDYWDGTACWRTDVTAIGETGHTGRQFIIDAPDGSGEVWDYTTVANKTTAGKDYNCVVSTQAIVLGSTQRRNGLDRSCAGMVYERLLVITGPVPQH